MRYEKEIFPSKFPEDWRTHANNASKCEYQVIKFDPRHHSKVAELQSGLIMCGPLSIH